MLTRWLNLATEPQLPDLPRSVRSVTHASAANRIRGSHERSCGPGSSMNGTCAQPMTPVSSSVMSPSSHTRATGEEHRVCACCASHMRRTIARKGT